MDDTTAIMPRQQSTMINEFSGPPSSKQALCKGVILCRIHCLADLHVEHTREAHQTTRPRPKTMYLVRYNHSLMALGPEGRVAHS